jgi:hypothetical protein
VAEPARLVSWCASRGPLCPGFAAQLGPRSRPHMLAKLDKRTKEGKALAELRDELTRHVGGAPSAVQRVLIERADRILSTK